MRFPPAVVLVFLSTLFVECKRDSLPANGATPATPQPINAKLQGTVLDENGQPASGVTVQEGALTTQTDSRGYFRFPQTGLDQASSVVSAEKAGYFKAFRSFGATAGTNHVTIQLVKKVLEGDIVAANGGTVTLSNGAKVQLPANGLVKASDQSDYTGSVHVYATYIDPTANNIGLTVPGSFMGDNKDGSRVVLQSYGMMAVVLESFNSEKLQLKSSAAATITIPMPFSMTSGAPASIPLWYLDETKGIWKEEGSASRQGNNYVGTVKHFSFWNCDAGMPAVNLSMTLHNTNAQNLVHTQVRIRRQGIQGAATHGWTDSLGQVSGMVPALEALVMEVLDPCLNVIYTQNIGPFSQANNNLGVITLSANSAITNFTGHISNCAGGNVSNGYAIIWFGNLVLYAATDAIGNFSVSSTGCSGGSSTAQIYGVDVSTQQQSSTWITVATPATNAGNLVACSQPAAQFINYTLDGVSYSINSSNPGDSLLGFAGPTGNIIVNHYTGTQASQPANIISFSFEQPNDGNYLGNFALTQLYIQQYPNTGVILSPPLYVTVTSFTTVMGQYYEGHFTGQFKDLNMLVHNVTCMYRVKKTI